jgi:hypothetical protein
MDLLFILQMTYEYGEPWWNDMDRGQQKNSDTNPFQYYKYHLERPGSETGIPPREAGY